MRLRSLLLLLATFTAFSVPIAHAQTTATPQARQQRTPAVYKLPPEKLQQAVTLAHKRLVLNLIGTVWGIAQLLLLLSWGIVARIRNFAVSLSRNRWAQGFTFFFLFLVITSLLTLPVEMMGHHISVTYNQSVQHWPSWFGDQAKGFALTFVFGGLIVMLLFWVIRKSPRHWWFWFWIPAIAISIFGAFVAPVFIDPIFNKFEPLQQTDPALVQRLEQVVHRGGISIPPDRMFMMKASDKVTGLNAYVTGLGASKRVVVWDTTIAKATPDEISFIFSHEMGHYVLNHIYKGLAFTAVLLLIVFRLAYLGLHWLLRRYGEDWRIRDQNDWGAFVVLMLVASVLAFLAQPVTNGFSRMIEHQADVYGQEAMHGLVPDPQALAVQSFQSLGESYLEDPNPNPFEEFWSYSHPSIKNRIAFASTYNPWAPGHHPRYFQK